MRVGLTSSHSGWACVLHPQLDLGDWRWGAHVCGEGWCQILCSCAIPMFDIPWPVVRSFPDHVSSGTRREKGSVLTEPASDHRGSYQTYTNLNLNRTGRNRP
jgi:hypothetical protein